MAELVLGPLLRYAGTEEATIWVETDAPCRVEVAIEGADACGRRTFAVQGHHYALVHCEGLQPGRHRARTRSGSTARRSGRCPTARSRRA